MALGEESPEVGVSRYENTFVLSSPVEDFSIGSGLKSNLGNMLGFVTGSA